ncbi:transcriptional regulator [Vibrio palustris]|uniref:Transcriptional activator CadC n=1 Tax=Vibrio palustris TaxID=1918946 RepID=A0A1R4B1C5_9VIBR|nr:winged helix-turn-helix domain-containing protein [Vibrio palustris]SJL82720.1 Transcriptional activator CadC [Vibrio palustris]
MSSIGPKFLLEDRFTFDPTSNSLVDKEAEDEIVRLGSNESRILLMLSQRPNEVVTRNELHDFVWREQGFEVDDSSLTQAISTLRKNLHDSTKSPMYVKTVPKRGYQLICTVTLLSEHSDIHEEVARSAAPMDDIVSIPESHPVDAETELDSTSEVTPMIDDINESVHQELEEPVNRQHDEQKIDKKISKRFGIFSAIALLVAILIPICALVWVNPTKAKLRHITSIDNITINAPINQPELTTWLPSIKHCIETYSKNHSGEYKPVEVIATGGQDNVLVLNYIHQPKHSSHNFTVKILANQHDLSQICQ